MKTIIYGCSDDLVEIDGNIYDEIGCYSEAEDGLTIELPDGTVATIRYFGDWIIEVEEQGFMFDKIIKCKDEQPHTDSDAMNAPEYSDVLVMEDDLLWVKINGEYFRA